MGTCESINNQRNPGVSDLNSNKINTGKEIIMPREILTDNDIRVGREGIIRQINVKRKQYNANELLEYPELSNLAQKHAELLAMGKHNTSDNQLGEHALSELMYICDGPLNFSSVVEYWYKDHKIYDNNNPKESNFTKLVWKLSNYVGVGIARNRNGRNYVVCHMMPIGGGFDDNVIPNKIYWNGQTPTPTPTGDEYINKKSGTIRL